MRRNKLYTVNRWNQNAFMPYNMYEGGGFFSGVKGSLTGSFTKEGMSKAGAAAAGAAISAGAGMLGGLANSAISGGLESGAGSAISGLGSTVGTAVGAVNPVLGAAIGVGSQLLGGLTNRMFGTKVNEAQLKAVNEGFSKMNSFVSNAGDFDSIQGPQGISTNTDVYSGGWFSSGKARRKNQELKEKLAQAKLFAQRSVDNNIFNVATEQTNDALANYSAYGGPLGFGPGALGIMQQDKYFNTIDNRSAALAGKQPVGGLQMPQQSFAFGGELGTNGTDWTNGLLYIDNGGSHEENPLEGVPMGFDPEGIPNLVEEGETIWNDYVFSDRIKVPKKLMKELGLGGSMSKDITFAEASKKLGQESEQRPNDPISLSGLDAAMSRLAEVQEAERMKNQMREYVGLAGYACGGKVHRYDDGSKIVRMGNGQTDFNQSVFELPEVVVTPQRPASNMSLLDVLSVMDASKGRELSTPSYAPTLTALERVKQIEAEQQQQALANYIAEEEEEDMRRRLGAGYFACGGKKYSGEENHSQNIRRAYNWDDFWKKIADYKGSMKAGSVNGNYAPDAQFSFGKYNNINDYEASPEYQEFTNRMQEGIRSMKGLGYKVIDESKPGTIDNIIFSNGKKPTEDQYNVLKYVQYAANRTPDSANTGFFKDPKKNNGYYYFIDNADKQLDRFRNDHKAGVFHLIPSYAAQEQGTVNAGTNWEESAPWMFDSIPAAQKAEQLSPMEQIAKDKSTEGRTVSVDGSGLDFNVTENAPAIEVIGGEGGADYTPQTRSSEANTYPTWMRYAPVFGAGIMSLTDALSLTNKPDYSGANMLEAVARSASYAPNVGYKPIGDYLTYRPMDIWYEQNRLNANSRATDRAILNSGANQGSKMAGLLASGYNDQIASGNLYRQALEYNDAKRKDVADFNRKTNMFNSQMGLEAAMANAKYRQQAAQLGLSGLAQAAALRDQIDARVGAARAANLSNFFNSLGDIGRENFALNQLNTDRSRRYTTDVSGRQGYKQSKACGGNMKRRKK